jgi:hypothetical protein
VNVLNTDQALLSGYIFGSIAKAKVGSNPYRISDITFHVDEHGNHESVADVLMETGTYRVIVVPLDTINEEDDP